MENKFIVIYFAVLRNNMLNCGGAHVPDEVYSFLRENNFSFISSSLVANGIQSCLYKIFVIDSKGNNQSFALKKFRISYVRNNKDSVFREYQALIRFHDALNLKRYHRTRTPKPIKVFLNSLCYLMEFISGETLKKNPINCNESSEFIAYSIANALALYHNIESTIYGDFHSGNVMRDKDGIVMIDCTPPVDWTNESWAESLKAPKISLDAGYWIYCSVCSIPKEVLVSPLRLILNLIFASKIVIFCSRFSNQELKNSINEIYFVTQTHLNKLARSSPKGLVLGVAGSLGFLFVRSFVAWALRKKYN